MGFIRLGHVRSADEQLVTQSARLAQSGRVSLPAASLIVCSLSVLVHISHEIPSRWPLPAFSGFH